MTCVGCSDAFHTYMEMPSTVRGRHSFNPWKVSFSPPKLGGVPEGRGGLKVRLFRPPLTPPDSGGESRGGSAPPSNSPSLGFAAWLVQELRGRLRLTEVVDDQGYLFRCVGLGLAGHAAGPEGSIEIRAAADPEVQVAQRAAGRLGFGEVEHGQFRLPVGTDFECFQMSWFWVEQ